jgi:hypothetical protein
VRDASFESKLLVRTANLFQQHWTEPDALPPTIGVMNALDAATPNALTPQTLDMLQTKVNVL